MIVLFSALTSSIMPMNSPPRAALPSGIPPAATMSIF